MKRPLIRHLSRRQIGSSVWLGLLVAAYALLLSSSESLGTVRFLYVAPPQKLDGPIYDLDLRSIDPEAQKLRLEVSMADLAGRGEVVVYLVFVTRVDTASHHTESGTTVRAVLKEKKRGELPSGEQPGPGYSAYGDEITIPYLTELSQFPLDVVPLALAVEEDAAFSPDATERRAASMVIVRSRLHDYSLAPADTSIEQRGPDRCFFFQLRRNRFLVDLSLFLLVMAFLSARMVIEKARSGGDKLVPITYFAALWGLRSVVLGPLRDGAPFPTYVDLTIVFLFVVVLVGAFWPVPPKPTPPAVEENK